MRVSIAVIRTLTVLILTGSVSAGFAAEHKGPKKPKVVDTEPWFYYDLGPNTINVSSYTAKQQANYKVFSRVCSECHTLARSINNPIATRDYWQTYVDKMRGWDDYSAEQGMTDEEAAAIVDFLDYDAKLRKIKHKKKFDAQTEELKRQYQLIEEKRAKKDKNAF